MEARSTKTVPAGVTQVTLDLRGAQGGGSYPCSGPREEDGGLGGQTQGSLVSVLDTKGAPAPAKESQRIIQVLADELK